MNKKLRAMISTIIIVVMVIINMSYAVSTKSNVKSNFMKLNSNEISVGDTLEVTFNLSTITNYKNFTIKLSSNISLNNAYLDKKNSLSLVNNKDYASIEIDTSKLNLDKISLYYEIPNNVTIGDKIEFNVDVITIQENKEKESKDNKTSTSTSTTEEITIVNENAIVTIIENKNNKDSSNNDKEQSQTSEKSEKIDSKDEKTSSNQKEEKSKSNSQASMPSIGENTNKNATTSKNSTSGTTLLSSQSSQVSTATYKGSNNNYLSNLQIESADLNTTFNKDNTTYFANVENLSSLDIIASAEDSTANVCITGNDNIKIGENKILISVTAQNGNVRYYRIFVTCKEASNE